MFHYVVAQTLGLSAAPGRSALPWAGTFHAIGTKLLCDCAARIGPSDAFTIHDRSEAEDLMGMVRHDLGFSTTHDRFPLKGTCLSIYSRMVNSSQSLDSVLRDHFPWYDAWADALKTMFGAYARAKQDQHTLDYDDLLLYWREMLQDPGLA